MHIRRSARHTTYARAAAAAAVGAALIVPLTGAVPGAAESAETAPGAPAVSDGVSPSGVSTPTEDPAPSPTAPEPDDDSVDTVVKAKSVYQGTDGGWVRIVHSDGNGSAPVDPTDPFDCTLGGEEHACTIVEGGFLAPASGSNRIPQPAAGKAERYYFSKDPQIEMTISDGKPAITEIDQNAKVSTSPFEDPSPSPTDDPTQGPSDEPTGEATTEPSPEPTNAPPEHDPPGDDDPRRESEPSEDDSPESTVPPTSPEDPNSGNGRRSVRVPGQAGDDWAPTGDGSSERPRYNYADPVPHAPGAGDAAEDAISAEDSAEGDPDGAAETSADSADDEATGLASATGSAWAIGGLLGIAAVAIGLVVFILGRSRRRRAH